MGLNGQHHTGPCTGKIKYLRRDLAEFEAQRLATQLNTPTSVYLCRQCGEYHVGKNPHGPFVPGAIIKPEGEFEREELVQRKIGIEAALDELRYGQAVDRGWHKKRRLIAEKNAIELRLSQIKQLRRERHLNHMKAEQEAKHAKVCEVDSAGRAPTGGESAVERQ